MRGYILPILAGIFVLVAVPLTVYLAANPGIIADIRRRASSPTGTATVTFAPASQTVSVGDTFAVAIKVTPPAGMDNIALAQIQMRYNYVGDVPEIEVVDFDPSAAGIQIEPGVSGLDYRENRVVVDGSGKTVSIAVTGANDSGFDPGGEYTQGIIHFRANAATSGTVVSFEQAWSKLYTVGSGEDYLLTPTAQGTYVVTGAGGPTPTPTGEPTPTPTPTPTPNPEFHYSCISNTCVRVEGAGTNTGGCTAEGQTCSLTRGYHFECRSNVCVRITGDSNDTGGCSVEGRGCLYQHKTCSNGACVTAYCSPDSSPCADNCLTNANCTTTTATTPTPTTTVAATTQALPVTGALENTLVMMFFGGLLLFGARALLAL
jgi:hypothetical protein